MATATAEAQDIVLTLHLSVEEAERLKEVMQNELHQDEAKALADVRRAVWHALNDAGVA
jgi:predicted DNA-binding protein (UPF0251 family)